MKLLDFDYRFPKELIAQYPMPRRNASRLLVLKRATHEIEHRRFSEIARYLTRHDVLVLNDTRVIPARLFGRKVGSGGKVELLLLERLDRNRWKALVKPATTRVGQEIGFDRAKVRAEVIGRHQAGVNEITFYFDGDFMEILKDMGTMPLPPYIKRSPARSDLRRYQTVYARTDGAIAATTAGLHFTKEILNRLSFKGVKIAYLTLHINYATFRPVVEDTIADHKMHSEYFELPPETVEAIDRAKNGGGRIVAVGTSSCRVLESVFKDNGRLIPTKGWTNLFIYPPYKFEVVDALLTNFHLPKTTLIMLVSAFCGRELLLEVYKKAIAKRYRLFSYGDAMLII